jgi:hypothetical protein
MPLDPPDEYENGGDAEAANAYNQLVILAAALNPTEIEFVNWLRKVYRNCSCATPSMSGSFVPGGALVFCGANIRLRDDNGKCYKKIKAKANLAIGSRTGLLSGSSHESTEDQFEVRLGKLGCILIGYGPYHVGKQRMGGNNTWLQNESYAATGSWWETGGHTFAFVDHKMHDSQQVGALGYSPFTEKPGCGLNCNFKSTGGPWAG